MTADGPENGCKWSREEDKAFENALATYPEGSLERWEKILGDVGSKSLEEIKHHYDLLVDDINRIESGSVPLPSYSSMNRVGDEGTGKKGGNLGHFNGDSIKGSKSDQERRKGVAWTEDEHRLFLLGLDKYGKGDWRSISRNFVVTRTPTQVASHAQKYFIRLNSMNKDRRRSSIHDITSVTSGGDVSVPQGPITGQANVSSTGKLTKQPPQSQPPPGSVGIYGGTTISQPVVGTPVNLPLPAHQYGPITYPMIPHTPGHR